MASRCCFATFFQSSKGGIELWVLDSDLKFAKVWLASALIVIAKMSMIDPVTHPRDACEMFQDPSRVWSKMEMVDSGLTLQDQLKLYSDFTPTFPDPVAVSSLRAKPKRRQKEHIQIVFDACNLVSNPSGATNASTTARRRSRAARKKQ